MANTYTQIYIQFVFVVKGRESLIQPEWEEQLYRYIGGIVRNLGHKIIAINGMPDHLHLLVGLQTSQSIADLMRIVKGDSSEWINLKKFVKGNFRWQEGYGAFSYTRSHLDRVYHYVMNQKKHHQKILFSEEYVSLLREFNIPFDERYLFNKID